MLGINSYKTVIYSVQTPKHINTDRIWETPRTPSGFIDYRQYYPSARCIPFPLDSHFYLAPYNIVRFHPDSGIALCKLFRPHYRPHVLSSTDDGHNEVCLCLTVIITSSLEERNASVFRLSTTNQPSSRFKFITRWQSYYHQTTRKQSIESMFFLSTSPH